MASDGRLCIRPRLASISDSRRPRSRDRAADGRAIERYQVLIVYLEVGTRECRFVCTRAAVMMKERRSSGWVQSQSGAQSVSRVRHFGPRLLARMPPGSAKNQFYTINGPAGLCRQ